MAEVDLIAAYLAELDVVLSGRNTWSPRLWSGTARIAAEVNDHLCEATERGLASGLAADEAQRQAIARFGSPRHVARRFVEERLASALPRALQGLGFALVAMFGCGWLEPLFPVPAIFHWPEPQPGIDAILATGSACQLAAVVLMLGCILVRRSPRLAAHGVTALGIAILFGCVAPGLGKMMLLLAQQGSSSHIPGYVRLAVALVAFVSMFPVLSVNDALSALRRNPA